MAVLLRKYYDKSKGEEWKAVHLVAICCNSLAPSQIWLQHFIPQANNNTTLQQ